MSRNKKDLLFSLTKKDFEISYFSGHGPGGQNRNKHMNCVRLKHPDSGATATGQDEKSKEQNLKNALNRLVEQPKFKLWHAKKCWEVLNNKTIEQHVNEQMQEQHLKIEVRKDDKWTIITENEELEDED